MSNWNFKELNCQACLNVALCYHTNFFHCVIIQTYSENFMSPLVAKMCEFWRTRLGDPLHCTTPKFVFFYRDFILT